VTLYRKCLQRVIESRVMSFETSSDIMLRSGFINLVERCFLDYFRQYSKSPGRASADIHRENFQQFRERWRDLRSDSTCLMCLRRRPQYNLCCGHCVCQTCIINFGDQSKDDPWDNEITHCFICSATMPHNTVVRIHPPTAGAGVLCIDGGGIRGVMPLEFLKRIRERVGLPIPFQRFFKLAFGVSSG
jgi:hypothetical protein